MQAAVDTEVIGMDGLRGRTEGPSSDVNGDVHVPVRLSDGRLLLVPLGVMSYGGGRYQVPLGPADADAYLCREPVAARPADERGRPDAFPLPEGDAGHREPAAPADEERLTLAEEELRVAKRTVETGRVRVQKRVTERPETVETPLLAERVEVKRVPVNRVVDAVEGPREEGGVTILPVYEEVLVVEKRLVLREEVHVSRVREERREPVTVTVRREEVEVERLAGADPASPAESARPPGRAGD